MKNSSTYKDKISWV